MDLLVIGYRSGDIANVVAQFGYIFCEGDNRRGPRNICNLRDSANTALHPHAE